MVNPWRQKVSWSFHNEAQDFCWLVEACVLSLDADKEIKYAFLTILKEALTNVQKHSDATRVKVVLNELEEYYQMMVEDNGTGQVNVYNPAGGIGLRNMEERVRALGGIITFSGEQGFRIFISVPKKKDV